MALRHETLRTVGTKQIGGSGDPVLWTVNVNSGVASAVLKIYIGTSASGELLASIDASSKGSQCFGIQCRGGIFLDLSGGNADCTFGYY